MFRFRILLVNAVLLLALAGSYWGRSIEDANVASDDFLSRVQISFNDWEHKDLPLTKDEHEMLEPDSVMIRRFINPAQDTYAEIAVIAGHRKKTLHTPGFCMAGGGWEVTDQRDSVIEVGGVQIPAVTAVLQKDRTRLMSTYFFTDGDYFTRSLPRFLAAQIVKRMKSRIPLGALVRIIVTAQHDIPTAQALSRDFSAKSLPPVFEALRSAELKPI